MKIVFQWGRSEANDDDVHNGDAGGGLVVLPLLLPASMLMMTLDKCRI